MRNWSNLTFRLIIGYFAISITNHIYLQWRKRELQAFLTMSHAQLDSTQHILQQRAEELTTTQNLLRVTQTDLLTMQTQLQKAIIDNEQLHAELHKAQIIQEHMRIENERLEHSVAQFQSQLTDVREDNQRICIDLERTLQRLAVLQQLSFVERLTDIIGIDPIFEKRLHDAGIYTLEHLAQQLPEQLREIVALEPWQNIDPAEWIAQAQDLTQTVPQERAVC